MVGASGAAGYPQQRDALASAKGKGPERGCRFGPGAAGVRQGRRRANTRRHPASPLKSALYAGAQKPRYSRALQLALPAFADLIADHGADRGAADRTDRAAAREDCTPEGTYAGSDRGVLVPRRHSAATTQAEQHCCGNRTDCKSSHRFHWNTFLRLRLTANITA